MSGILNPTHKTQLLEIQLDYQDYTNQIILGLEFTRARKPYSINIFANGEVKGRKNNGHERMDSATKLDLGKIYCTTGEKWEQKMM